MFRSEVTAESLLHPLNAPQREAVITTKGPVLVLAGGGQRQDACDRPSHRVSAGRRGREPASRHRGHVHQQGGGGNASAGRDPRPARGHSPAAHLHLPLRRACASCASALSRPGSPSSFVIYDEDDRQALVKEVMRELDFDERTLTPATVVHRISHAKNQMLSVEEVEQLARGPREERIASLYRHYEERSTPPGPSTSRTSAARPAARDGPSGDRLDRSVGVVLVDEFQDTNTAQYRIVRSSRANTGTSASSAIPTSPSTGGAGPTSGTSSTSRRTSPTAG